MLKGVEAEVHGVAVLLGQRSDLLERRLRETFDQELVRWRREQVKLILNLHRMRPKAR